MKKIVYGFIIFNLLTLHAKEANACCGENCEIYECGTRLTYFGRATRDQKVAHCDEAIANGNNTIAHGKRRAIYWAEDNPTKILEFFNQAVVWISETFCRTKTE